MTSCNDSRRPNPVCARRCWQRGEGQLGEARLGHRQRLDVGQLRGGRRRVEPSVHAQDRSRPPPRPDSSPDVFGRAGARAASWLTASEDVEPHPGGGKAALASLPMQRHRSAHRSTALVARTWRKPHQQARSLASMPRQADAPAIQTGRQGITAALAARSGREASRAEGPQRPDLRAALIYLASHVGASASASSQRACARPPAAVNSSRHPALIDTQPAPAWPHGTRLAGPGPTTPPPGR